MSAGKLFTVVLIGASGLLRRAVARELATVDGWRVMRTAHRRASAGSVNLDIRDHDAMRSLLWAEAPDAIVVAAAERRPDVCENDPELARALNVDALDATATETRALGAWVLSISTDYVFDGSSPPYASRLPALRNGPATNR